MRRAYTVAAFCLAGAATTWAACWIGSRMSFRLGLGWGFQNLEGCWEVGVCTVPAWYTLLLYLYFLGPSIVFAAVGWRTCDASSRRLAQLLALLVVGTASLYLVTYALE